MTAEELYEHMKDALDTFGLRFHQKDKVKVKLRHMRIIFEYDSDLALMKYEVPFK